MICKSLLEWPRRKGYAWSVDIVLFPSILARVWLTLQILDPQIQRAYYMVKPRKTWFPFFYLLQPWHFRRDCIAFPKELSSLGAILALNLLLISGPWFLSSWASFSGSPLLVPSSQALTLKYTLNTNSRKGVFSSQGRILTLGTQLPLAPALLLAHTANKSTSSILRVRRHQMPLFLKDYLSPLPTWPRSNLFLSIETGFSMKTLLLPVYFF